MQSTLKTPTPVTHRPRPTVEWMALSANAISGREHMPLECSNRRNHYKAIDLNVAGIGNQVVPAIIEHTMGIEQRTGARNTDYAIQRSIEFCLGAPFARHYGSISHPFDLFSTLKKNGQISSQVPDSTSTDPGYSLKALQVAHDFLHEVVSCFSMQRSLFDQTALESEKEHENNYAERASRLVYTRSLARDLEQFVCHGECPKVETFMHNVEYLLTVSSKLGSVVNIATSRRQKLVSAETQGWQFEREENYKECCHERKKEDLVRLTAVIDTAERLMLDIRENPFSVPDRELLAKFEHAAEGYLNSTLEQFFANLNTFALKPRARTLEA